MYVAANNAICSGVNAPMLTIINGPKNNGLSKEPAANLLSPPVSFPGENPEDFEKLQAVLIQELAPKTHMQQMVVGKIVRIDWHWQRYILMMDQSA